MVIAWVWLCVEVVMRWCIQPSVEKQYLSFGLKVSWLLIFIIWEWYFSNLEYITVECLFKLSCSIHVWVWHNDLRSFEVIDRCITTKPDLRWNQVQVCFRSIEKSDSDHPHLRIKKIIVLISRFIKGVTISGQRRTIFRFTPKQSNGLWLIRSLLFKIGSHSVPGS